MFIKTYHSFCSDNKIIINGHVLKDEPVQFDVEDSWLGSNIKSLFTLFRVKPMANIQISIELFGDTYQTISREDGFFSLSTTPQKELAQGWHLYKASSTNLKGETVSSEGKFFKPYKTSHGIISDIDDTVLKSYSASILRRLYELFTKNPETRKLFDHTVEWYRELSECPTPGEEKHPFFYVSSSEWNLYGYLNTIFKKHQLPKGIFLLNDIKTLSSFFKTGKTGHRGKYDRIKSLLEAFPEQNYVLIGDNTQRDPYLYRDITNEFPGRIIAVFLRNKVKKNADKTRAIMEEMQVQNDQILLFDRTLEAFKVSKKWGLITYEEGMYYME